jgi:hypothetical protein
MYHSITTNRPDFKHVPELVWVERISRLLDSQFRIPGTNWRFGLDPLIGLIPVLGDLSSFAISGMLLTTMARNGVSRKVLFLMAGNLLIDTVLGSIPFIGNIFDFTYQANQRNIRLLQRHYQEGKYQGSGVGLVFGVLIGLAALLAGAAYLSWKLGVYLMNLF